MMICLLLSTETSADDLISHAIARLRSEGVSCVGDLMRTRHAGRVRVAVRGRTAAQLIAALEAHPPALEAKRARLALAVPGMGTEPFWQLSWRDCAESSELQRVAALLDLPNLAELLVSAPALLAARDVALYQRVLFAAHLLLLHVL